jgi:hypothetical protein
VSRRLAGRRDVGEALDVGASVVERGVVAVVQVPA